MKLSLEALEALDAIDRHGSFAAAAKALHRVPSALTYTVQKLEQDLDALLFDRSGHRAVLTEAGLELLREGRHLLAAAGSLECRVRQVAKGWEAELVIAVNDLLPKPPLYELIGDFYAEHPETRLRLTSETLSGCWDALADGRADLVVGASGDPPPGGGYGRELLGELGFVFALAPAHPLALAPEPLPRELRARHRAVVMADSSRRLPARTVGLLSGQETLTVPGLEAKLAAQLAGLGVGYLPDHVAAPYLASGQLVTRLPEEGNPREPVFLVWRSGHKGRALAWFRERLLTEALSAQLMLRQALSGANQRG
jgi:DNA-binding transcriptional LysR family regulator